MLGLNGAVLSLPRQSLTNVTHSGTRPGWVLSLWYRFKPRLGVAAPSGLSLAGLIACTWLSFHFGQSFAFTGFLYLVLVILAPMYGGFWQATVISLARVEVYAAMVFQVTLLTDIS